MNWNPAAPLPLWLHVFLVLTVAAERVLELRRSRRHAAMWLARGAREAGAGHWPLMQALHTALLTGWLIEPLLTGAAVSPRITSAAIVVAVLCQIGRHWVQRTLGDRWNARVIVMPGLAPVRTGPYRWVSHPNYLIVAVEGLALPAISGAWWTAAVFTLLNAVLMVVRVRCENTALQLCLGEPGNAGRSGV